MIEDSDAEPSETPQRLEDVSVATSKVVKNAARENKKKKRAIPPDEVNYGFTFHPNPIFPYSPVC